MTAPEPRVVDDEARHRFEIRLDGELAGYAEYERAGGTTSFVHTSVDDRFAGRGVGSALARGALDATRAAGQAVLPVCPFIRAYVQRHPEYADLVPADRRAEFDLDAS